MVLNAYFLDSSQAMASSANSGVQQLVQHWLRTHAVCEVSVQSLVLNNLGVDFLGMKKKFLRLASGVHSSARKLEKLLSRKRRHFCHRSDGGFTKSSYL
jgi:hypothetical protein